MIKNRTPARLILADGTVFEGASFGCTGTVVGEVVFTTGVVGYQETLTDPSYFGQIVTQTFPLIGNYGVNGEDNESDRCHFKGYIVREWCEEPSNFRMTGDIDAFLKENGVVGIWDIDTRALTRKLREHGVMNGMITTEDVDKEEALAQIAAFRIRDAVASVSVREQQRFTCEHPLYEVALYDFGYKQNILRWLLRKGFNVTVVPAETTVEEIKALGVDGVMLSNGPGDPAENVEVIENLRELLQADIPIFGICLGHQLMALAAGGRTFKLHYGHRGGNQPVLDLKIGRTFVTSQNHGYAVDMDSIPPEMGEVSHVNVNDRTCEGVRYTAYPCLTVQFHPEACSGPQDTNYLFDEFVDMIKTRKGAK